MTGPDGCFGDGRFGDGRLGDGAFLAAAIEQARLAESSGNLPVGAVVVLEGRIVGRGHNQVYRPRHDPTRHAEIVALSAIPEELRDRFREMTVYTTLEPCVMCAGALFLHHVRRVVFGSSDERAGAESLFGRLPRTFQGEAERVAWEGPVAPDECDPLRERLFELVAERREGRRGSGGR